MQFIKITYPTLWIVDSLQSISVIWEGHLWIWWKLPDDLNIGQVFPLQKIVYERVVGSPVCLPAQQGRDWYEAGQDPDGDDHDKDLGRGPLKQKQDQFTDI